jgi:hypothetical protein
MLIGFVLQDLRGSSYLFIIAFVFSLSDNEKFLLKPQWNLLAQLEGSTLYLP